MFAFIPSGAASWQIVAFSALCALSVLSIGVTVAAIAIFLSMRGPRVARHSTPARAPQPQPTGPTLPVVAMARTAG